MWTGGNPSTYLIILKMNAQIFYLRDIVLYRIHKTSYLYQDQEERSSYHKQIFLWTRWTLLPSDQIISRKSYICQLKSSKITCWFLFGVSIKLSLHLICSNFDDVIFEFWSIRELEFLNTNQFQKFKNKSALFVFFILW